MGTEKLFEKFVELISKYGEKGRLFTFNYCTDYGVKLGGSTIDAICFKGGYGGIAFYYNENTGDCDMFNDFSKVELEKFYVSLIEAIAEKATKDCEMKDDEPKQYKITIVASEFYVADSLRRIANWIENNGEDYPYDYEDADCCATIEEV